MTDLALVLVTAPNADVSARLARGLVTARLAACVNVLPGVRSFYVWDGELEDATEEQLLIKTRAERVDEVVAWVTEHHPYDVPEVLAVPVVGGAAAYLAWVTAQTAVS